MYVFLCFTWYHDQTASFVQSMRGIGGARFHGQSQVKVTIQVGQDKDIQLISVPNGTNTGHITLITFFIFIKFFSTTYILFFAVNVHGSHTYRPSLVKLCWCKYGSKGQRMYNVSLKPYLERCAQIADEVRQSNYSRFFGLP